MSTAPDSAQSTQNTPGTDAGQPAPFDARNDLRDVRGDAASARVLGQVSRAVAGSRATGKAARKAADALRSALGAMRQGDFTNASRRALDALALDERNGNAWHVLAIAQEKCGRLSDALNAYEAALKLLPDETEIAHNLGRLAHRLGYLEIAGKLLQRYLAANPGHVEATNNLACVLRDENRYDEAIELLRALITIDPAQPVLWNTLGTVLTDRGDMAASLPFFDEALRLDADFAKALYNRGVARMSLGDADSGAQDMRSALALTSDPMEQATIRMALALTLMGRGDLEEGFALYEARLDPQLPDAPTFLCEGERWQPDTPLDGRHLLVMGEQGLGDEVLFANILPDTLRALGEGGQMTIALEPRLIPLFARSFPSAQIIPHRTVRHEGRIYSHPILPEDAPRPDLWVPMASLFQRFRRQPDQFPRDDGYLTPDPARIAHWREQLALLGPGPKVGLGWRSQVTGGSRARQYAAIEAWYPVLATPGVHFVNIQYGDCTEELERARAAGHTLWTPPGINLKDDLEDVAALCVALDAVMGPSTATLTLGGASGANAWFVITPGSWTPFGTERIPAYPKARTFVLPAFNAWDQIMSEIGEALHGLTQ